MKKFNRAKGRMAEDYAASDLEKKGYRILERNYHTRFGEIDIIAKDGNTLVFVEVKAKTGLAFGSPEDMVTRDKLFQIKRLAEIYMKGKQISCRIDIVAVLLSPSSELIYLNHYQSVY